MRTKKFSKIVTGAVVACGIVLGGAAMSASATTSYPSEGGTWNYGVRSGGIYGSGGQVYSEYYHGSRTHKSTACSQSGCDYSGWASSGSTSVAHRSPASFGGNTAYYDVS